jgi:pimeloyl-ACP methyl ester carboxylesterase
VGKITVQLSDKCSILVNRVILCKHKPSRVTQVRGYNDAEENKMPVVFVHGVPDTYRLWDGVRSHLNGVDTIALALPGFGAEVPPRFQADKESYVDWIIDDLSQSPEPVDLVGHDWGGIFALRVASLRPDLVRTVAAGNGPISRDYEWHELAKTWQTPVEGEEFMQKLDTQALSNTLEALGVPPHAAISVAERLDDRMKDCILKLYRSAVHVGEDWQPALSNIKCPSMIFWGRDDKECPVSFAHQMATQLSNGYAKELDCRHWVPLEKPKELAMLLRQRWSTAG